MGKRLIVLSLLVAMCGGCASVQAGLTIAHVAFQIVKFVAGSGDKADPQESEMSDETHDVR